MTPLTLPAGLTPADLAFGQQGGLLPAVVQDAADGRVLMVGYQDQQALAQTLRTGLATFYSRSRGRHWVKGETSGNTLRVLAVEVDCDGDTLLLRAEPAGPTCHTGARSCFDAPAPAATTQPPEPAGEPGPDHSATAGFVPRLAALVRERDRERPAGSYTTSLLEGGTRRVAQKVGEEGVETALAAVAQDDEALLGEAADLVYHLLVLLRSRGLEWEQVDALLRERHGR